MNLGMQQLFLRLVVCFPKIFNATYNKVNTSLKIIDLMKRFGMQISYFGSKTI